MSAGVQISGTDAAKKLSGGRKRGGVVAKTGSAIAWFIRVFKSGPCYGLTPFTSSKPECPRISIQSRFSPGWGVIPG